MAIIRRFFNVKRTGRLILCSIKQSPAQPDHDTIQIRSSKNPLIRTSRFVSLAVCNFLSLIRLITSNNLITYLSSCGWRSQNISTRILIVWTLEMFDQCFYRTRQHQERVPTLQVPPGTRKTVVSPFPFDNAANSFESSKQTSFLRWMYYLISYGGSPWRISGTNTCLRWIFSTSTLGRSSNEVGRVKACNRCNLLPSFRSLRSSTSHRGTCGRGNSKLGLRFEIESISYSRLTPCPRSNDTTFTSPWDRLESLAPTSTNLSTSANQRATHRSRLFQTSPPRPFAFLPDSLWTPVCSETVVECHYRNENPILLARCLRTGKVIGPVISSFTLHPICWQCVCEKSWLGFGIRITYLSRQKDIPFDLGGSNSRRVAFDIVSTGDVPWCDMKYVQLISYKMHICF